jgi:uncharacterized coiled-coil protein SlyX
MISLEEKIAIQEEIITRLSRVLDDAYSSPDKAWIEEWLSDEIEKLEALKNG